MTLEEAKEIKSRTGEDFLNTDPAEIDEAERLSVEAMKLVILLRGKGPVHLPKLLPGETD